MITLLEQALLGIHLLSSAAWFGALVYRTFFIDPKAFRYFTRANDFEQFSVHLADGMRGVVVAALLACGLSGCALLGFHGNEPSTWWWLLATKAAIWVTALGVFIYISWVFWPRRVFAVEAEYPRIRREGLALSLTMITLAGLGLILGQAAATATAVFSV